MKLLAKLVFIPIAAAVIVFAVANRHAVTLELWPLPFAVDLPVYLAILGALVIGIVVGGSVQWAADTKWRRRARVSGRKASALARELSSAQETAARPRDAEPEVDAAPRPGLLTSRFRLRSRAR